MRRIATRERLLRQAATWFERIHENPVSPRHVQSWERWMTRSAANRQAYRAVADVCRIVGRLRDSRRLRPH
jgi:ferric-dicitrate binding protein FerR (iron transport regulator)